MKQKKLLYLSKDQLLHKNLGKSLLTLSRMNVNTKETTLSFSFINSFSFKNYLRNYTKDQCCLNKLNILLVFLKQVLIERLKR